MDYKKHTRADLKMTAFSVTGFIYSVTRNDIDRSYEEYVRGLKQDYIKLTPLICRYQGLLAYKDCGHFPKDIVRLADKRYPNPSQQQEKYDFAVKQLDNQIDSLRKEIRLPREYVKRMWSLKLDCLAYFHLPTTGSGDLCSCTWSSCEDLRASFEAEKRGYIIDYFDKRWLELRDTEAFPQLEKFVCKANKHYQKVFDSLQGKKCSLTVNVASKGDDTKLQGTKKRKSLLGKILAHLKKF